MGAPAARAVARPLLNDNVRTRTSTSQVAALESSARVGTGNGALPAGNGTVDRRPVSEHIEEPSLGSVRNLREADVPVPEEHLQFVAQLGEIAKAGFQLCEPLGHQRPDAAAWGAPTLALRQRRRQVLKREANRQRPPYQSHALDRFWWVETIPALAAGRDPEDPLALVVPQRIRTDARQPRER